MPPQPGRVMLTELKAARDAGQPFEKPQANLERLEGELTAASRAVDRGAAEVRAAKEADDEARADAKVREAPVPEPKAKAIAERHEAAQQELADTKRAVEKVKPSSTGRSKRTGPRSQQVKAAPSKVREDYLGALDQLEERHRQMAAHEAQLRWLHSGRWTPDAAWKVALAGPNGEGLAVEALLGELRERGLPPKQKILEAPTSPLSRSAAGPGVYVA